MYNTFILGAGRSGTSMVAALFRSVAGVFYGNDLLPPTAANVHGYYEDRVVNLVNDLIIRDQSLGSTLWAVPRRVRQCLAVLFPAWAWAPDYQWLAAPKRRRRIDLPDDIADVIRAYTSRQPFCLKDPRFTVTLPYWLDRCCNPTRVVVVFRQPLATVRSIMHDARCSYDPPLAVTPKQALNYWYRSYRRILHEYAYTCEACFVHYDDVVTSRAIPALSVFTGAMLDCSQLDPSLCHHSSSGQLGACRLCVRATDLYQQLLARRDRDLA